jgi:hypothetical protein
MEVDSQTVIVAALFAISEVLGMIPAVKSNGIFQFIANLLKALSGKGKGG